MGRKDSTICTFEEMLPKGEHLKKKSQKIKKKTAKNSCNQQSENILHFAEIYINIYYKNGA
jgi:hypothetical protein